MSDRIITESIGNEIITSIKIADGSITADKISANTITVNNLSPAIAAQSAGIKINNISYQSGLSVAASGELCDLIGSGFYNGAVVFVANYQCSTFWLNSTTLRFTVPSISPGTYWVYVKNTDGAASFRPNAIVVSSIPTWVSPGSGSIGTSLSQNFVTYNFFAVSDSAVSYTLESGTLPPGMTLAISGNLSGTIPASAVPSSPYYFTIRATDAEAQIASRSYNLSVQGSVSITNIIYAGNRAAASSFGGETVTVQGSGFLSGATVKIGNQAPLTTLVANSTSLSFMTVSGNVGSYSFAVVNPNGSFGNIANLFTYSSIQPILTVEYLVVAGGGAGGPNNTINGGQFTMPGGGGGAGGYVEGSIFAPVGSYTVTVGGGGTKGSLLVLSTNGGNSSIVGDSLNITSVGGGAGGSGQYEGFATDTSGKNGGSGGGGAANNNITSSGRGLGISGQGNNGGTGLYFASGGGGGAGGAGNNSVPIFGPNGSGGPGRIWRNGTTYARGGSGFGAANPGTGNGGDPATNGGSGVVIFRYFGNVVAATGGNITSAGGYIYHIFGASDTFTFL